MGRLLPDPELERLVEEMNRGGREGGDGASGDGGADGGMPGLGAGPSPSVSPDGALGDVVVEMIRRRATDLLLVPGSAPVVRIHGGLHLLQRPPVGADSVREMLAAHLGGHARRQLAERGATEFSLRLGGGSIEDNLAGWRLRVSVQRQRGGLAAAIRALPRRVPELAELGLPEDLGEVVRSGHGLVLVCGPTGSGKSTTLAALVDVVNRGAFRHVVTIEEPIEYQHDTVRSVVEQIEVGTDAPSFAAALRAALRRDPDVILVGEMLELETIATVLTAAETGHLILSTLHTRDASSAVNRVVDVFPAEQQTQVRQQLALALRAIVSQQLVPRAGGAGRVPAIEVLRATTAVRAHIRAGNLHRIYNEMLTGRPHGMVTMEESLAGLVTRGIIDAEEARMRAPRPDELSRRLG